MTEAARHALLLSFWVGAWCVLLGLVPAVGLGWLLARRRFPGKGLLSALLMTPVVLPPVVTGFLLLQFFGKDGPAGVLLASLGLRVPFTVLGAVIAAGVVGFPFYLVGVRGAMEAVDPRYEEVAATLGVPPWRTFLRVTLPLASPGIAAGAVLTFARALGEFGATVVLAGNVEGRTRTLALAVYSALDAPGGDGPARTLVLASLVLGGAAILAYEALVRWQRRRLELDSG